MTTARQFRFLGLSTFCGHGNGHNALPDSALESKFVSLFGLTPDQTNQLWNLVQKPEKGQPKHLLWTLYFIRQYDSTVFGCHLLGVSPKTWRKWVWAFVHAISALELVSLVGWLLCCCLVKSSSSWSPLFLVVGCFGHSAL